MWKYVCLIAAIVVAVAVFAVPAQAAVMPPGQAFANSNAPSKAEEHCGIAIVVAVIGPFTGWTIVRAAGACVGAAVATGR